MKRLHAIVLCTLLVIGFGLPCQLQAQESNENTSANEWKRINPNELQDNSFKLFGEDWMELAVGKENDMNAMTIAWGELGILWSRPVVTVFVSPSRYTHSFLERNDYFTVTAFPEEYREALGYLGSHSGRDGDKIKASGLTVSYTDLGNPIFNEARLAIECRKIYSAPIDTSIVEPAYKRMYLSGTEVHHLYIGEIVNVWVK